MNQNLKLLAVALVALAVGAGGYWLIAGSRDDATPPPRTVATPPPDATPPPTHAALPRMQVQAQYGGPLQDTLIQRLRDPIDGTVCYVYLPIAVHHTAPDKDTGYIEYGANGVGSISCYPPPAAARPVQRPVTPPPVTPPAQ